MKSAIRTAALAIFALAAGAGPSLAAGPQYLTAQPQQAKNFNVLRPYSGSITATRPCISREVYVPGPDGRLGYYKDSCTGAFIRPAVN